MKQFVEYDVGPITFTAKLNHVLCADVTFHGRGLRDACRNHYINVSFLQSPCPTSSASASLVSTFRWFSTVVH